MKITKEAVELAAKTIEPYIHRTPVLTSKSINELTGIDFLLFKYILKRKNLMMTSG